MTKHYVSTRAICPEYRYQTANVIHCNGIEQGAYLHLAFDNQANAMDHKKKHCYRDYEQCRIYKMLQGEEE